MLDNLYRLRNKLLDRALYLQCGKDELEKVVCGIRPELPSLVPQLTSELLDPELERFHIMDASGSADKAGGKGGKGAPKAAKGAPAAAKKEEPGDKPVPMESLVVDAEELCRTEMLQLMQDEANGEDGKDIKARCVSS